MPDRDGSAPSAPAHRNGYATVTITNCTISDNVGGNSFEGGGIDNGGTMNITGSTMMRNSAGYGGAIRTAVAMTIANSTISDNSAAHFGGGIDNVAKLTVTNTTISTNSATGDGGGISHF